MAFEFELHCKSNECLWYHTFFNSKRNNKKLSVQSKMFDINLRAVYSMRRCGNGYANLTRFLMLMNHPPPMSEKSYRKLNNKVNNSVKIVASNSMNAAAEDIKAREATSADEHLHNYIDTVCWHLAAQMIFFLTWSCCCNIYGKWKDSGFRYID